MKRNFFNRIGGALAAAVAVAGLLFGCSDIAGTGDEGGSASKGSAAASVFIPDYDALAQQVSGARAVAPQTAKVRLSSAASPAAFSAVSQDLSEGTRTEGTNEAGVAGYSYKFTFRIPVGEYAAGSLKVETLGSDGSTLTSGVSASAVTVKAGEDAATAFTLVPAAADASYSGALGAGEMQFITVTVPASSSYEVTATEGVTLFLFDASGKYSSTLTGTEIENSTEEAVTYYIGIYNAGTSAIESCSVTASAAVKSAYAEFGKEYDIHAIVNASASATETDDKAITWSGVTNNGSGWTYLSASTESLTSQVNINVSGAAVVTLGTYQNKTNGNAIAVSYTDSDGATGTIVDAVTDTSSIAPAFLYSGTKPAVITITAGGMVYLNTVTVTDGKDAANGVANVTVTGATEITKGNSETYTATVTAKYINTDSNKYTAGTVTWAVAGSDAASITEAGVLAVADTLTEDATLTVTATCDEVSSEGYTVSATTSAKTVYELVTWVPSCFSEAGTKTGTATADLGGAAITIGGSATTYSDKTNIVVNNGGTLSIPVSAGSVLTLTHNWNARYTLNDTECKGSATYTATTAGYVLLTSLEADGGSGATGKPAYFTKITVSNYKTTDDFTAQATGSVTNGAVVYYTVTFNSNGGTDGSTTTQKVESGVETALTTTANLGLSYDGHTFSGWATSADSTKVAYADGASVTLTEDTTLYAVWTESGTGGETTTPDTWSWKASDVTTTTLGVEKLTDKGDADNLTLLASCLSTTGDGNVYRTSSDAVSSIELAKSKGGAAVIVIASAADLKLEIGSNSSTGTTSSIGLYSDSKYSTLVAPTSTTGTLDSSSLVSVTGGTASATITYRSIEAGTYYFVTGDSSKVVRLSAVDVTTPATVSDTTTVYSKPTVTLSASTASLNTDVTATAEIPNAKITTTWSDSSEDVSEEKVSATITWSAADSEGNAASIIGSDGKITTTAAGTFSIYASYTIDGTEYKSDAATLTLKDVTLYTVTFDANGGTDGTTTTQSFESGAEQALTAVKTLGLKRLGYTFSSWNTKADGTGTSYSDGATISVTENTTLYAQWNRIYVKAGTYNLSKNNVTVNDTEIAAIFSSNSDGTTATDETNSTGIVVTCKIDSSGANLTTKNSTVSVTFAISQAMTLTFIDSNKKGIVISATDTTGYVGTEGTISSSTTKGSYLGVDGKETSVKLGAGSYKIVGATTSSAKIAYLIFAEVTE